VVGRGDRRVGIALSGLGMGYPCGFTSFLSPFDTLVNLTKLRSLVLPSRLFT